MRLEKAKKSEFENKPDESLENLALALKSVNRALEMNGTLLEAIFNKAPILDKMQLTNQAQAAWENYLKPDAASEWANEARRNLEKLQKQNGAAKDKSQVLKNFLESFKNKDDPKARQIAEESNRNIFFDGEQTVYDIAADYAYTRLRDGEQAFDYAENSRARSLLDLIKSDQTPLTLAETRRQMPADIQIIYYAVLKDKLLIWHVSNSRFTTV